MAFPVVQVKKVFVTGCSSGIGLATARILCDAGWEVVPSVRKNEDLERLEAEGFTPVELDIAHGDSVQKAAGRVLDLFGGTVGGLVNNAGFGQAGAMEDVSREALRYQFEVNVFGMQELTNCFIPHLRKQGWGRIVNVSSVLGRVSVPMLGSYCASKHAMESLSDALRVELRSAGIAVSLIEPGPIISAFRRNAAVMADATLDAETSRFGQAYADEIKRRKNQKKKENLFTKPPEAVARKIAHALTATRPRARYCITIPAYLGAFARRFVPTAMMDALLASKVKG